MTRRLSLAGVDEAAPVAPAVPSPARPSEPDPEAPAGSAAEAWMRELHADVERRRHRRRRVNWSEALDTRSLVYMGIALIVAFLVFAVLRWMEWRDVVSDSGS